MRQIGVYLSLLFFSFNVQAADDAWSESYRLESLYQFDAALERMQSILSKSAKNEFAQLRVGWLQYQQGNYGKSVSAYREALELNANSLDARLGLSLPLLAQQRWREAALYLKQVLDQAPYNYTAHTRLMLIEEAQKQWSDLKKHATDLHRRYPSDATVLVYLARAEDRSGNKKAALQAYEQVLQILPQHAEALWYVNH